jgi:hypothetical protein
MNFRNMITCVDCDDDDDAVSRLRCWVSSQSYPPSSFDEGEWRRRRQVRRAYAKRGVAFESHFESETFAFNEFNQYDAVHDSVSPDSTGERVVGGHETPQ